MNENLHDAILQQELQVWEALKRGDAQADDAALCHSFWGVYADGMADKADHLAQLAEGPSVDHYHLCDVRVRPVGVAHALIAYRATFARVRAAEETMLVSSLWERGSDGWRNIFSQDTPAR